MNTARNKYYLLNLVFLFCVLVLFVNDHYLKLKFSNWLTGKLSDAAGIIIFPLLLAFLFPKLKRWVIQITALLFVFWKSSLSQTLIDFYNEHTFIQTSRVVDYTDLYVLVLLPVPYFIIRRINSLDLIKVNGVHQMVAFFPTIFILMATSPPPSYYYTRSAGNLQCYKCSITVHYNQSEIVKKLTELDIVFDSIVSIDSFALARVPGLKKENAQYYRLNRLIIEKDTLKNLDFTMRTIKEGKTKIYFNGMQVAEDISDYKLERKLRDYYKQILFKALKKKLK
ncbi:MAG: hypothetical protein ABI691_09130 [Ginsengibacter sp.]